MTDCLRDRIAAACQAADQRLAVEDEMPTDVYYSALADAVIADLGLRQERHELLARWVTDWQTKKPPYCQRCGIPHTASCRRPADA